jgi:hypothetical protein
METQPPTQLATKLAFSSSRELCELVETSLMAFGDGWYRIFEGRFSIFCFKELRLIGRCLWFTTMKQSKQTKPDKLVARSFG